MRRRDVIKLGPALAAAVIAAPHDVGLAATAEPRAGEKKPLLGLHYLGATHFGASAWPRANIRRVRLWDIWDRSGRGVAPGLSWGVIHKAPGVFDFSLFEDYVALARSKAVEDLIYTCGWGPEWAGDPRMAPEDPSHWIAFCRELLARCKATDLTWTIGIWNEPNASPQSSGVFWRDTPAALARMGGQLYALKKEIFPKARVLSPETQGNGASWMDAYMAAYGGRDWDVLGVHLYGDGPDYVAETRRWHASHMAVMRRAGVAQRPVWNTEIGWEARHGASLSQYLRGMAAVNGELGVERLYWYAYDAPTGRLANPPRETPDMDLFRSLLG